MAHLEGGSTISGYPILHSGMRDAFINGTLNLNYLHMNAQDASREGGEIRLAGAAAHPAWNIDVFDNSLRMHSGGTTRFQLTNGGILSGINDLRLGDAHIRSNNAFLMLTVAGEAQQIRVGSLLISNTYNDATHVPTNGAYIKGNVVVQGDIAVHKTNNWSNIYFPAQLNDPGYIAHWENNNNSEMRFCVSDDRDQNDFFSWGSTPGGTWSRCTRLFTNGTFYTDGQMFAAGDKRVYHTGNITYGTGTPSGGSSGDIYIQL